MMRRAEKVFLQVSLGASQEFLESLYSIRIKSIKGGKSKAANAVLITYAFEGRAQGSGLQMEPFAFVFTGEQTLTHLLPSSVLRPNNNNTLCFSVWMERKTKESKRAQ